MSEYTFNLKGADGTTETVVIEASDLKEALNICRRDYGDSYSREKPYNRDLAEKL